VNHQENERESHHFISTPPGVYVTENLSEAEVKLQQDRPSPDLIIIVTTRRSSIAAACWRSECSLRASGSRTDRRGQR